MPRKNREERIEYNRRWRANNPKYANGYYLANKSKWVSYNSKRRAEARNLIESVKSKGCCIICGESHPACLDFHHRDRSNKKFSIAWSNTHSLSVKTIEIEIAKCDLLCANCHRKLHWAEKSGSAGGT